MDEISLFVNALRKTDSCVLLWEQVRKKEPSLPLLQVWNCPPGGVLFWLGRPKKEPKKLGLGAWPPALHGQEADQIALLPNQVAEAAP
ncbi:hypothetical protein GKC30_04140 [Pseudodesulfovibrio sp. F-1]|uniref:Uncharacterized protein n=1 Tax=Pseudodesulfovibrio alkaliphilus TaxID=2661613 RepID=A0A7K1KLJ0_9BACT|nr:hypothetical protein [Pseudodesulfovibrio alkaliphilus]MUM76821.1 hypothetical protein [Pseudodesulfovibrio alkaliphilus]